MFTCSAVKSWLAFLTPGLLYEFILIEKQSERINSRITEAEEWISDLEDRMAEFTAGTE